MTPEISFEVVIFEQIVKKYYTYVLEYILKNILVKQIFPFPLLQYFQKHFSLYFRVNIPDSI